MLNIYAKKEASFELIIITRFSKNKHKLFFKQIIRNNVFRIILEPSFKIPWELFPLKHAYIYLIYQLGYIIIFGGLVQTLNTTFHRNRNKY